MISCYEGVLGGGKSYHAVKHILSYLAKGGNIYANIPLVWPQVRRYCRRRWGFIPHPRQYHSLTLDELSKLDKVVVGGTSDSPSLLVVDEIHLYFNSRDWATTSRSFLAWLTQSRKLHCDCIFITQNHLNMDKQFTRLLGRYWHFRDLRQWKLPGLGIRWPLKQFFSAEIDQDGKTVLHSRFEPIDSDVFKCYSSDQLFDGQSDFAGRGRERERLERLRGSPLYSRYRRFVFFCGNVAFFGG